MAHVNKRSKETPRILVIKHGALGDIVQALDGFASIRNGHPSAHIAILVGSPFYDFVKMMPWFDEVISDRRAHFLNLAEARRLRSCFNQSWSLVIDMQGTNRTKWYMRLFGHRTTCWISRFFGASVQLPNFEKLSNTDRFVEIARIAEGIYKPADMEWLLHGQNHRNSRYDFWPNKRFVVLVPGCSLAKPQKRWPAVRFAELANALIARGLTVFLVGTEDDRTAVDAVLAAAADAVDLCGKTNLVTLAQLLHGAAFVIRNDTGPIILATKTGTPTLMLMGPDTNPLMSAPTGRATSWLQAAPITQITAKAALDALEKLGLEPVA